MLSAIANIARVEVIGDATLVLADCAEVLPLIESADALLTDPTFETREALEAGHPLDVCECGDYRRSHGNNGSCEFNKGSGNIGHLGAPDCHKFRLAHAHLLEKNDG
jgi:ribosomal protein L32